MSSPPGTYVTCTPGIITLPRYLGFSSMSSVVYVGQHSTNIANSSGTQGRLQCYKYLNDIAGSQATRIITTVGLSLSPKCQTLTHGVTNNNYLLMSINTNSRNTPTSRERQHPSYISRQLRLNHYSLSPFQGRRSCCNSVMATLENMMLLR